MASNNIVHIWSEICLRLYATLQPHTTSSTVQSADAKYYELHSEFVTCASIIREMSISAVIVSITRHYNNAHDGNIITRCGCLFGREAMWSIYQLVWKIWYISCSLVRTRWTLNVWQRQKKRRQFVAIFSRTRILYSCCSSTWAHGARVNATKTYLSVHNVAWA